jgi:hypothetical protein
MIALGALLEERRKRLEAAEAEREKVGHLWKEEELLRKKQDQEITLLKQGKVEALASNIRMAEEKKELEKKTRDLETQLRETRRHLDDLSNQYGNAIEELATLRTHAALNSKGNKPPLVGASSSALADSIVPAKTADETVSTSGTNNGTSGTSDENNAFDVFGWFGNNLR